MINYAEDTRMACPDCHLAQIDNMSFPYRWKDGASLLIIGCGRHVREVMTVLNQHVEAAAPHRPDDEDPEDDPLERRPQ